MSREALAKKMFDVIPPFMNLLRTEIKECARPSLTVPQFRVLANIHCGLIHVVDIANHHGVSQPSMTKLINNLVDKGLVSRKTGVSDRRMVDLQLTGDGQKLLKRIKKQAYKRVSGRFKALSDAEVSTLIDFMDSAQGTLYKITGEES